MSTEAADEIRAMEPSGQKVFPRILDLCAGSGCIALALAKEFPGGEIYASDVSEATLKYARGNAEMNALCNVAFFCGSLFDPVRHLQEVDLIISNPPYIRTADIDGLQREIREWEPQDALDGGKDGLDFYRRILSDGGGYLGASGMIMLEREPGSTPMTGTHPNPVSIVDIARGLISPRLPSRSTQRYEMKLVLAGRRRSLPSEFSQVKSLTYIKLSKKFIEFLKGYRFFKPF